MRNFHNLSFVLGSTLIMLSLFLPLAWNFIDSDYTWCFPFFDASTQSFNLYPSEYRCYLLMDILPHYFHYSLVPIYLTSKRLIPNMVVSVTKSIKVDMWLFISLYTSLLAIDLFLSFSQTQYFRTFFIMVGCALQIKWMLGKE